MDMINIYYIYSRSVSMTSHSGTNIIFVSFVVFYVELFLIYYAFVIQVSDNYIWTLISKWLYEILFTTSINSINLLIA